MDWRSEATRIGALPHFGYVKTGRVYFLITMEDGYQLGPAAHKSKAEVLAYAYYRDSFYRT